MLGASRGPTASERNPVILACIHVKRGIGNFDISEVRMLDLRNLTSSCPSTLSSIDMDPCCEPAELGQDASYVGQYYWSYVSQQPSSMLSRCKIVHGAVVEEYRVYDVLRL